jgi:hypothetical protein
METVLLTFFHMGGNIPNGMFSIAMSEKTSYSIVPLTLFPQKFKVQMKQNYNLL